MPRITPLEPPFEAAVADQLDSMMPVGVPPIALFRTFAHNMPMTEALSGWGAYYLSRRFSLTMQHRELVIIRVTARCRCEYEWGIHMAFFAERVALTRQQRVSITHGKPNDGCWSADEIALLRAVDELHDQSTVTDGTWTALAESFTNQQILDVLMLSGWYHAISFAANATNLDREAGAPRFEDVR